MIIRTRTGVRVSGTLRWDGTTKNIGSKKAFVLTIKAYSEKQPDGQWLNYDVNARIWGEHPELEDMFLKGDFVAVEGPEVEDRPGSDGKIYHNLTADDVTPGARVILRWMQQQIDICYEMIEGVPSPFGEGAVPSRGGCRPLLRRVPSLHLPVPSGSRIVPSILTGVPSPAVRAGKEPLARNRPQRATLKGCWMRPTNKTSRSKGSEKGGGPLQDDRHKRRFRRHPIAGSPPGEWYDDPNTCRLFFHLMLTVNYQSKEWRGDRPSRRAAELPVSASWQRKQA